MASNIIEKINTSNYASWSIDIKCVLIDKGLWDIIESAMETLVKSETIFDDDVKAFKQRSNQVLSVIFFNIENGYQRIIADCSSAVETWSKILLHFHPDSRSFLMKSFTELI